MAKLYFKYGAMGSSKSAERLVHGVISPCIRKLGDKVELL